MVAINKNSPSISSLSSRKSYANEAWATGNRAIEDMFRTSIKPHDVRRGELCGAMQGTALRALFTGRQEDYDNANNARETFVRNEFFPEPGALFHALRANYHYARYFAHSLFN